jgi:omega-amidase
MNVTVLQFDITWERPEENFATVEAMLADTPPPPGGVVVLPEMFATGFSMNAAATLPAAESILVFLARIAQLYNTSTLAGLAMADNNDIPHNMAVLIGPGGDIEFTYAKRNPFPPAGEPEVYAAGSRPGLFELNGKQCSVGICYDFRFDDIFTEAAAAGVEIFFIIANFPAVRREDWIRLLAERARELQACVVGVNRIGQDPNETYAGDSVILSLDGKPIAAAPNKTIIISAELDYL